MSSKMRSPRALAVLFSLLVAVCVEGGGPVLDLLTRVLGPSAASNFVLSVGPIESCTATAGGDRPSSDGTGQGGLQFGECATVRDGSAAGTVEVRGTSTSSLAFGIGQYLRERCNTTLTWVKTGGMDGARRHCGGDTESGDAGEGRRPRVGLPVVGTTMNYSRAVKFTYYQNVVDASYSFAWWDWNRWQIEIDWMALSGINLALVYTGQEMVLRQLYQEHGVNLTNSTGTAAYFNGPAFLSWSRGQGQVDTGGFDAFNDTAVDTAAVDTAAVDDTAADDTAVDSVDRAVDDTNRRPSSNPSRPATGVKGGAPGGAPGGALPDWWIDAQGALGQKQALRMRELGIRTILRGFENNVPEGIKEAYPLANITAKSNGQSYLLDALDPLFTTLSDRYMQILIATFGTDHYYQADGTFTSTPAPWYNSAATAATAARASQASTAATVVEEGTEAAATKKKTVKKKAAAAPVPSQEAKLYSQAAYAGMTRTDPDAVWVYQTWGWHWSENKPGFQGYVMGWMAGVPKERHLLLDQSAEMTAVWKFWDNWAYDGHPFIWCSMSSMGGNLGLYGDLFLLSTDPTHARQHTARQPTSQQPIEGIESIEGTERGGGAGVSSLVGVGLDPEGIDNNPAYWQLLLDGAWQSEAVNVTAFLHAWGARRCGGNGQVGAQGGASSEASSARVKEAWTILGETVYAASAAQHYEHHMAYCPTYIFGGGIWDTMHGSEDPTWYKATALHTAWGLLIDAAKNGDCDEGQEGQEGQGNGSSTSNGNMHGTPNGNIHGNSSHRLSRAFVFDLVDVGREYLSIAPCMDALHALSTANTTTGVAVANATMSTFMSDLDRLLASSDGFLLGQWVTNARNVVNWSNVTQSLSSPSSPSSSPSSSSPPSSSSSSEGSSDLMADFLEWNARAQVTSWVPALGDACEGTAKALPPLYDYGNKAWAGLVKGYYDKRYMIYAQSKMCQLADEGGGQDGGDEVDRRVCDGFSYNGALMKLACDFQHEHGGSNKGGSNGEEGGGGLSAEAVGDALAISEELWAKYAPPTRIH